MVFQRSRSHAALVAVTCVAALVTSVAQGVPLPQKKLNTEFSSDFRATNNNGGLDFDFSSSSSIGGGSSIPSSSGSISGNSGSSGSFSGSSSSPFGGSSSSGSSSFGGSSSSGSGSPFGGSTIGGSSSFGGSSSGSISGSQGTQPNFFEQLARTSQLVGSMLNSFFTSLGRQNTQGSLNGGSSLTPLVAIDTRRGAPTIDIPGILGLNTGHTRNGGGDSLVSVSTQQGTRVRAPFVNVDTNNGNTRVQAPFTDVNTNKGATRVQAPFVNIDSNKSGSIRVQAPFTDVHTNGGGTRVQAPFTDVQTNGGGTRVQAPFTNVQTNGGGTRVQAPFVTVDHQKETNEIHRNQQDIILT